MDYVCAAVSKDFDFTVIDVNTMREFVESSLIVNPERSTDERLKSYLKLFEDHGALSLVSVDSASATKVTLGMTLSRSIRHEALSSRGVR